MLGEEGKGIKQRKKIVDRDKSMLTTTGKGQWGEVEEGKEGINGDGRRLDLGGGEHTIHYTDAVL